MKASSTVIRASGNPVTFVGAGGRAYKGLSEIRKCVMPGNIFCKASKKPQDEIWLHDTSTNSRVGEKTKSKGVDAYILLILFLRRERWRSLRNAVRWLKESRDSKSLKSSESSCIMADSGADVDDNWLFSSDKLVSEGNLQDTIAILEKCQRMKYTEIDKAKSYLFPVH